ncbi:MAG: hypothetical protein KJ647_01370 [Candidatus Omnitrophica bacterium]|nr:hypothetical protein [Candidatus Omnitrophota bacterium]
MPFKFHPRNYLNFKISNACKPDLNALNDKWGQKIETEPVELESTKLLNHSGEEKNIFMSNEYVKFVFEISEKGVKCRHSEPAGRRISLCDKDCYLWLGIYRDDGIYCQGIARQIDNEEKSFEVVFPRFPLLPGGYKVSLGIWNNRLHKFLICHHAVYLFQMIFDRQDHGTIYLEHNWEWRLD